MHPLHTRIKKELKRVGGAPALSHEHFRYHGSTRKVYDLSVPERRKIVVSISKGITSPKEVKELAFSLGRGETYDERVMVGMLLETTKFREILAPALLKQLLAGREGWAEIDHLCQSLLKGDEFLKSFSAWKNHIEGFKKSKDIALRRGALVLLVRPSREVDDERLKKLCFETIDALKHEKDILITKAISWLLREMVVNYKKDVSTYLSKNADTLPKIAVRETKKKLLTGKKNG